MEESLPVDDCRVQIATLGSLQTYQFVVIFARYQGKWLYCRAKNRDCFETAGGHIEVGETPLDAARREFYEETGSINYDMTAVFDNIPDRMRFPEILPILFEQIQCWLNLQSAKEEIWDIYDRARKLTGKTHRRGDPLVLGDYHLVVHVWIINNKGEFLISQRAPTKGYPLMWECTGGSAISGDDSITAAIREVEEELGLTVSPKNGVCLLTQRRGNDFCDVWLFREDFSIEEVVLQENETVNARWASLAEIREMMFSGEFVTFDYFDELFGNDPGANQPPC